MNKAVLWNYRKRLKCYRENDKRELKKLRNETLFKVFNEDKDTAEIYLHGPVRRVPLPNEDKEDIILPKVVRKELKKITADIIKVHISSKGGDYFAGIDISNYLRDHSAKIETIIDGVAASAGSIIYFAGDTLKMYKNTSLLVHRVKTVTYGNSQDHREAARRLDKLDKSLKENYKERFTGTAKELQDLLESEDILTAAEAKAFGFCDEIIDKADDESGPENRVNRSYFNRNRENEEFINKLMRKYGDESGSKNKNLLNKLNGGKR